MPNLKWCRFMRQMPQEILSFKTGIHQTTLSRIERGLQKPSDEQWEKIADVLKVPVSELTFYSYDEQEKWEKEFIRANLTKGKTSR